MSSMLVARLEDFCPDLSKNSPREFACYWVLESHGNNKSQVVHVKYMAPTAFMSGA